MNPRRFEIEYIKAEKTEDREFLLRYNFLGASVIHHLIQCCCSIRFVTSTNGDLKNFLLCTTLKNLKSQKIRKTDRLNTIS